MRRKADHELPEVEMHRQMANKWKKVAALQNKCPSMSSEETLSKKLRPCYVSDVANYLPNRPSCEDEESICRHIQMLKREHRKKTKNHDLISTLMRQTFADRRKLVIANSTISELKEQYPCLFNAQQV